MMNNKMLKYLKKHSSKSDEILVKDAKNPSSESSLCEEIVYNEEFADERSFSNNSRLSMNINGILNDKKCLEFFEHYLENKKSLSLLKFYLDIEYFRMPKNLSNHHDEMQVLSDSSCLKESEKNEISKENDKKIYENSNVPELKTICDISMRKPITDDEKSKIYAQTNMKITECTTNDELLKESKVNNYEKELRKKSIDIDCASFSDAINIYKKYLTPSSTEFVELPIKILSEISLSLCSQSQSSDTDVSKIEKPPKFVSCKSFDEARQFILKTLESEYLNDFLQSSFYLKYCVELIANTTLKINDILGSETLLFYFMEFIEQNGHRDYLDFWVAAINYRKHYTNLIENLENSKKEAQTDAMIIYEKYFSLQSETQLGLSAKIRSNVEEHICKENSEACDIGYCFDLPLHVVAKFLEKNYLKAFVESSLFANFVKELNSKIVSDQLKSSSNNTGKIKHRKSMSDCTDINSFEIRKNFISKTTQHSTLLATDGGSSGNSCNDKQGAASSSGLNTDKNWKSIDAKRHQNRSSNSGHTSLSFGRVDPLGRYERDFDTVDSVCTKNWSLNLGSNKIKNTVRKLVNLPEDDVQEEIAWQIAEMIIKDVTDVTMSKSHKED